MDATLLPAFAAHLRCQQLSERSIRGYLYDVGRFLRTTKRWTLPAVEAFIGRAGLSACMRRRETYALRHFGTFLVAHGYAKHNHALQLKLPRIPKHQPPHLSEDEAKRLVEAPTQAGQGWMHLRDAAILELLYRGLRNLEVRTLRLEGIQMSKRRAVLTVIGKKQKERQIPIAGKTFSALKRYLGVRGELLRRHSPDAVFLSWRGRQMAQQDIGDVVKRWAHAAGVKNAHPHKLRHSHATHCQERGSPLAALQDDLGHDDPETTRHYAHGSLAYRRREIVGRHPRSAGPVARALHWLKKKAEDVAEVLGMVA